METGFSELQVFISLVVVLGTAFVALVVDYLKGNNEQLREHNVELRTRREENDRTRPLEAMQWVQNALASSRSATAPAAKTVPARPAAAAARAEQIAPAEEPAAAPRPAVPAPSVAAVVAQPAPAHGKSLWEARREALRRVSPTEPATAPVEEKDRPAVQPAPEPAILSLLESLPKPEWVEKEREAAAAEVAPQPEVISEPVTVSASEAEPAALEAEADPVPPALELISPPVIEEPVAPPELEFVPEPALAAIEEEEPVEPPAPVFIQQAVPVVPAVSDSRVDRGWQPKAEPVVLEVSLEAEPEAAAAPAAPERQEAFWSYRGLLDRVVEEQEVRVVPGAAAGIAAGDPPSEPPAPAAPSPVEPVPAPVKSPLSKWASRLQTNRGMHQRHEGPSGPGNGKPPMPSWVDRALQKEAERTLEPVAEAAPVEASIPEPEIEPAFELAPPVMAEIPAAIPEPEPEIQPPAEPFIEEPQTVEAFVEYIETPAVPVEPEPVVAPEPDPALITPGYHDRSVLTALMQSSEPVNGVLVAIGINDYQNNVETMGRQAMQDLMRSVERMIRGLLREEDFACRSNDDEFILFFPNETGAAAQRRLTTISEKLWNFQLRSLSSFSVLFSWGAVETQGDSFPDAVAAASERMYQTKRSRKATEQRKKLAG